MTLQLETLRQVYLDLLAQVISYLGQSSGKLLILSLAVTVCCCEVWCGFSLLAPSLSKKTTQGERQSLESRTQGNQP